MRVWIDLANSPHVPLMEPIAERLRGEGNHVLLTARDHAQTVELARRLWPEVEVQGRESPPGRAAKGRAIAARARQLRRFARRSGPDVAFSHGSYAQVLAAMTDRIPAVVMMDYEHQPANHLSFRLARRVVVPSVFPEAALRRFGARARAVVRYRGFKEELYLGRRHPDPAVLDDLRLDPGRVIAVLRPPPEGALYHRTANRRFDEVLDMARRRDDVQAVVLPRTRTQADRYRRSSPAVVVPDHAVDAQSLLALADLAVGAGGTMSRESAVLGTPTYTVFAARLPAVDRELIRLGRLRDLRRPGSAPAWAKKAHSRAEGVAARAERILVTVTETVTAASARPRAGG
jgi:predicted glycosyltransferase